MAAAAVKCSSSKLDLIPGAVNAVIVAFRTGKYVTNAAAQITGITSTEECWSIIVPGATSSASVEEFSKETVSHHREIRVDTQLENSTANT